MSTASKGDEVLAWLMGGWCEAEVRHVHGHGLFTVVPHVDRDRLVSEWVAVSSEEIVRDDRARFSPVFARWGGGDPLTVAALYAGLTNGEGDDPAPVHGWVAVVFGADGVPERLDEAQAYRVIRHGGYCAAEFDPSFSPTPWFRFYWNQIRMGGLDPSVAPTPGPAELLEGLGLTGASVAPSREAALARFEAAAEVALPPRFREMLALTGIEGAFRDLHPNNPELVPVGSWRPLRGARALGHQGDVAFHLVTPHQGDHQWWASFDPGEPDVHIDFRAPGEPASVYPVAPSFAWFLWDLDRAWQCWEDTTRH